MRKRFAYFSSIVEMENLGGQAAHTTIVDGNAIHTKQGRDQLETQIGNTLEGFGSIGANRVFTFQDAAGLVGDLRNQRRDHFKIIAVVRQNSIEVMAVPGIDPLSGKMFGESFIDHERFQCRR